MKGRGKLRQMALDLGFSREWAERVASERPADVERWSTLGEVPIDEDPRLLETS